MSVEASIKAGSNRHPSTVTVTTRNPGLREIAHEVAELCPGELASSGHIRLTVCAYPRVPGLSDPDKPRIIINRILDSMLMIAAVVQVSKPVLNSRHEDSAPVQPLCSKSTIRTNGGWWLCLTCHVFKTPGYTVYAWHVTNRSSICVVRRITSVVPVCGVLARVAA